MAYYLDLFSPETYEMFANSGKMISGFRQRQLKTAKRIKPGDRLVCYMTKLSRWVGVLEVKSECFTDNTPIFYKEDDPFIVRFRVEPIVWLEKEKAIPIREDRNWNTLSFTAGHDKHSSGWTGKVRASLTALSEQDGAFLEAELIRQVSSPIIYPVDVADYQKKVNQRVRRADKTVTVSIPSDTAHDTEAIDAATRAVDHFIWLTT